VAKLKIRRASTRRYEAVYIFESALEDAAILEKLEKLHALLETTEPIELEHWGRRALAYNIGRHEQGYYVIAHFTIDPKVLPEFERAMKLDGEVIRYLITLYEHELGAPKLSDEEMALRRRASDDDDDDDDED
jgi:small subunit ribosomal protein S6